MTRQEIGTILMRLREKSGKSREEVGDLLGKSAKTVGHWETGYAQPDANTLFLLCTIYDADLNQTFGFEKQTAPPISGEAMQLAKDYDTLDQWGRRAVRSAADNELARVKSQTERTVVSLPPHTVAARGDHVGEGIPNDQIDEEAVNAEVARLDPNRGLDTR